MTPLATFGEVETDELHIDGRTKFGINLWLKPKDVDQVKFMLQAMAKFDERNARYNDLWQQGGVQDSAHHAKSKALRLMWATDPDTQGNMTDADLVDDAIDLINYAVFFLRNLEAGRR